MHPSVIRDMAELADRVKPPEVQGYLFVPPRYPSNLDVDAIARIRSVVRRAFDGPPPQVSEWPPGRCP